MDFLYGNDISRENAGNKAFMLNRAADMSFSVPPFFAVSVSCMRRHMLSGSRLMEETLAAEIIENACRFLQGELFAVRSSGLMEDDAGFSFAGQFNTILRVRAEELPSAVLHCWDSASSPGLLSYCMEKRISEENLCMGIIIQEMVDADFSGVIFTVNPQGLLNESVIIYGASTGEGVVADKTPVSSYYFNRTDRIFYYETQPGAPLASHNTLAALIETGENLEEALGFPADIEYAIKDGKINVLQVRPITTLDTCSPLVFDNSNIAENYPGLSLPLTRSFVKEVYYQVFKGAALRCLPNKSLVRGFDGMLREMVGSVNGRMYYKISNWYTVLSFMPFQKKIMGVWRRMMGVKDDWRLPAEKKVPLLQRFCVYIKIFINFISVPGKMNKLNLEFIDVKRYYDGQFPNVLKNNAKLLALYDEIAVRLLKSWDITLMNDMYAFVFTGLLEFSLKRTGVSDYSGKYGAFLTGNQNLESMKPLRSLASLAKQITEDNALIKTLKDLHSDADAESFMRSGSEFAKNMLRYIDEYGDRGPGELKLESVTYRVSPLKLVETLLDGVNLPENPQAVKYHGTFLNRGLSEYFSRKAHIGIANRETSRLNRSRIFGMVRGIFRRIGENMTEQGLLESMEDIFYLELPEIFDFVKLGYIPESGFIVLIKKRRKEYGEFAELPAYSRLIFSGEAFDKHIRGAELPNEAKGEEDFTGVPCSGGTVEGEVIVIHDPSCIGDTRGKIIVAKTTDPGWVFMLAKAGGIITEKGSLLSHAAIISRELGIPSVVNVSKVTSLLRSGDYVRLDGNKGEIKVIDRVRTNY